MPRSTVASKTATPPKKQLVNLIDTTIPLPESVAGSTELVVRLNSKVLDIARKATDALVMSRNIPVDTSNLTAGDPLALVLLAQDKKISGEKARRMAAHYYEKWREEANHDAFIIALTMDTKIDREPRPYEEEADDDVPDWLQGSETPEPVRDLTDRYERRLKSIYDILNDAGAEIMLNFNRIINDNLADCLRELGVGKTTDEAGFQS